VFSESAPAQDARHGQTWSHPTPQLIATASPQSFAPRKPNTHASVISSRCNSMPQSGSVFGSQRPESPTFREARRQLQYMRSVLRRARSNAEIADGGRA